MIGKRILLMLMISLTLSGCAGQLQDPKAGLSVLDPAEAIRWGIPNQLLQQGTGNSYRVMSDQGTKMLELAAGNQGHLEYFVEVPADISATLQMRMEFLSTQGTGRIKISALDNNGNMVGETGSVFTGQLPQSTLRSKWKDVRYKNNYQGGWIEESYHFSELLATLSNNQWRSAAKYRLSVEVGEGQHAFITQLSTGTDIAKAIQVLPTIHQFAAKQGDVLSIAADVQNVSQHPIESVDIKFLEPHGYGLVVMDSAIQSIGSLAPGEKRHISWQVQAQRADIVNMDRPWSAQFSVNDVELPTKVQVAVKDTRPGKVFYVMTEDLEPIDGAGYPKAWGNCDSWLEPEEFLGQMVNKSEKLNRVAEKYGAKWTHYIAWPAVKAAEWAGTQSKTGEWQKVVSAIKASVVQEAGRGHEYGIHFHSDYDPYLPGNLLSYNGTVDGLWANHLKHGWAHSVTTEGAFSDYASRAGLLYAYQRILDELEANSPQGQLLTARAGSFDFGNGSADEAMSTNAFKKVGLWGSSDADGNAGGLTTGEYGREIYFAAPDDINASAKEITKLGIVEFRPTPKESIEYNSQSAAVMNLKADQGMQTFAASGVKPGVHAIVGFTHAMFVMGQGDWKSTEGGQFQALDDHLSYLKQRYVDKGLLSFATASELVESYLDYYTPILLAVYGQRLSDHFGIAEYGVHLLGKDISIDKNHTHIVSVKYPLYMRDSAYRISILKNGQPIYSTWGLPTPFNDISFVVDDKTAVYTLKIYHNEAAYKLVNQFRSIKAKFSKIF
jgi:hypothetical protein